MNNVVPPTVARTLVVMLGASIYPGDATLSNERFKASAEAFKDYFLDPVGFGLPADNLLWLFDAEGAPTVLNDRIEAFFAKAKALPADQRPLDVIIYYIGHGFLENKEYYLATRNLKRDAPDYSLRFQTLQRTVKKYALHARKFYILDACFSGAAVKEMMGVQPAASLMMSQIEREAKSDLPGRGTAALCATASDSIALAPAAESFTMLTGALLAVLEKPLGRADVLSLHQVHALAAEVIHTRFGDQGVRPEIHVPEQKDGDVGAIPLFTIRKRSEQEGAEESVPLADMRDAFDPTLFEDAGPIHAVVIGCMGNPGGAESLLTDEVRVAWENFSDQITAAANRCREGRRLQPIPSARPDGGFVLSRLAVERVFDSEATLQQAVAVLCRAEVAIFDLTNWDLCTTFLLGIRAVARRGVTVASIGGDFTIGGELSVPFNLQLLNFASHSEAQQEKGSGLQPWALIGAKIANGFRELANLPHYLDLPAFDAVRQLGVESDAYRPIQYSERVLVLCPFGHDYTARNWRRLEKEIPGKIKLSVAKATGGASVSPILARLLDMKTPRLVAQTLFESIRLTDMCLIDWSNLRANVAFEAGVRMATNPLGAVHVIEAPGQDEASDAKPLAVHVRAMLKSFSPIEYSLVPGVFAAYDKMIKRFEASLVANGGGVTNSIYAAVGKSLDQRAQPAAQPLVDELIRSANILESDDHESTGISPVLYHEVNPALVGEARDAAADRRLAAWLYLSRRWRPEEIVADERMLAQFRLLASQVRRWARKVGRNDLLDEIKVQSKLVMDFMTNEERGQ